MKHKFLLLPAFAMLTALASGLPAHAHDGTHQPKLLIEAPQVVLNGKTVLVQLDLTNLGSELTLENVSVAQARSVSFSRVTLAFAQDVSTQITVAFPGEVPGLFTAVLDFGIAGQGPVLIIPSASIDTPNPIENQ